MRAPRLPGALILFVVAVSGCTDIPGVYYGLKTSEPSPRDCARLGDALTATLNFRIKSQTGGSGFSCFVTLDNTGASPPISVDIAVSKATRLLTITVHEYRWGEWTQPSGKTTETADRIVAIAQQQFPTAEVTKLPPPKQPFAP